MRTRFRCDVFLVYIFLVPDDVTTKRTNRKSCIPFSGHTSTRIFAKLSNFCVLVLRILLPNWEKISFESKTDVFERIPYRFSSEHDVSWKEWSEPVRKTYAWIHYVFVIKIVWSREYHWNQPVERSIERTCGCGVKMFVYTLRCCILCNWR
jgi:hypothetical protein